MNNIAEPLIIFYAIYLRYCYC